MYLAKAIERGKLNRSVNGPKWKIYLITPRRNVSGLVIFLELGRQISREDKRFVQ